MTVASCNISAGAVPVLQQTNSWNKNAPYPYFSPNGEKQSIVQDNVKLRIVALQSIGLVYDCEKNLLYTGEKLLNNLTRLDEMAVLADDWNGYGANGFSQELIDKCKIILNELSHQPDIYPTGRQSIQFQYQLTDKSYLEFEVFKDKTLYLNIPKGRYNEAFESEVDENELDCIKEIVDNFYGN